MIVEFIGVIHRVRQRNKTLNLLIVVLAYANGTPYSLRSVGSVFRGWFGWMVGYHCFYSFL